MRIGLDGFPLAAPKTGVGHYTFELARALSMLSPGDHFELISPSGFSEAVAAEVEPIPNLSLVHVRTNMITRRWWGIGLPGYIRRAGLDLFHGTNYEVPLLNRKRTVVTVHDLSVFLHADKHETRIARRARRRLPVMLRSFLCPDLFQQFLPETSRPPAPTSLQFLPIPALFAHFLLFPLRLLRRTGLGQPARLFRSRAGDARRAQRLDSGR